MPGERYVTHYQDCPNEPLYAFGYGLSYTRFEYGDIELDRDTLSEGDTLRVVIPVTNVGDYDGQEVVQLYIRDVCSRITRPEKELKGFRKIALKKGETQSVVFHLSLADLEYVLADGRRVWDPGMFELFVGGSSTDVKRAEFMLK